ncbi:phosphatidylglycerol lysyltransferase domain-containing protein [uncultured Tateyamaria sp.]|uniref:phosphatidylglycerol lysyltransferase domain-containing protein n=1 Tax=uncultured Tateyamaria sp. TaxID=455651 RepID=UPI0026118EFA|nr:phosphatidylglycerol lysyltransferase domain-containing protein [uncultured Tateyamaria sp.]
MPASTSIGVRKLARAVLPLCVISICAVLVAQHLTAEALRALPDQMRGLAPWQWAAAFGLTLLSFSAVAQYDLLAHRHLGTGVSARNARISGAAGIALGQTLGLGVVSGALVRWRLLPDLSLIEAGKLSALVSATFVLAWGTVTAIASLLLPAPAWTYWPALAVALGAPVALIVLFVLPRVRIAGRSIALPQLSMALACIGWATVDLLMAAGALYVLLPQGAIELATFLPLFLIALGCGLVSNTPGGVGPFELVLLTATPWADPTPLLAAILAFRAVYYAVPALIAALVLLRPLTARQADVAPAPTEISPRSEVGVVVQNGGRFSRMGVSTLALWPTGGSLVAFADPVAGNPAAGLDHLNIAARQAGLRACLYKCGPRMAHAARLNGWQVLHIADEAVLPLPDYTTNTPARRTLRRKLRTAAKSGLVLRQGEPLPLAAMARVDAEWQVMKKGARGGSVGRFCPDYVARQWVGCAYRAGRLVAFVTAHRANDEWCLDIMRHSVDAPDGTMHALVDAAIRAARKNGAARFSLAATPACPEPASAIWRWAALHVSTRCGGPGLRQFKSSFVPIWVPRYAAARSRLGLALGLLDIAQSIRIPSPIEERDTSAPHDLDEYYEVASNRAA